MIITAIALGLVGSLHCIGMCSPLAITVTNLTKPAFINRVVYNFGRILSYGVLGIFASSFGTLFKFTGMQDALSLTLGCILIVAALAGGGQVKIPVVTRMLQRLTFLIKQGFSKFLAKKTFTSIALMGALNGLLPCGLTYVALTYCITLSTQVEGFVFMIIFGVGTLPAMLGLTSILQILINRFNFSFRKIATFTLVAVGLLLISRSIYQQHETHPVDGDGITLCR